MKRSPFLIALLILPFFSCKNDNKQAVNDQANVELEKIAELTEPVKVIDPQDTMVFREIVEEPIQVGAGEAVVKEIKKKKELVAMNSKPAKPATKKNKPKPAKATQVVDVPKNKDIPVSKIDQQAREYQRLENQTTEIVFKRNFFSFGEIVQGDTIYFKYDFTNIGEKPLIIKDATATCGCTHPTYPFTPILPGESGEITGMYVSDTKKGPQNAMVKIVANTDPSIHKLMIDGTVLLPEEVEIEKEEGDGDGKAGDEKGN